MTLKTDKRTNIPANYSLRLIYNINMVIYHYWHWQQLSKKTDDAYMCCQAYICTGRAKGPFNKQPM